MIGRQKRHFAADGVLGDVQQCPDADIRANGHKVRRRQRGQLHFFQMAQEEDDAEIKKRPVRPAAVAAAPAPVVPRPWAALDFVRKYGSGHAVDCQQQIIRRCIDNDPRQDLMVDPFHKKRFPQNTQTHALTFYFNRYLVENI